MLIPLAIEAQMPLDEFWYGEEDLFYSYVKAYRNRVNYTTWMQGIYNLKALEVIVNNVMPSAVNIGFGGGKVKPVQYYDKPINMDVSEKEQTVTEEDRETEYRRQMCMF